MTRLPVVGLGGDLAAFVQVGRRLPVLVGGHGEDVLVGVVLAEGDRLDPLLVEQRCLVATGGEDVRVATGEQSELVERLEGVYLDAGLGALLLEDAAVVHVVEDRVRGEGEPDDALGLDIATAATRVVAGVALVVTTSTGGEHTD